TKPDPLPPTDPVVLMVFAAPAQSWIVVEVVPVGTLIIFSTTICASTVELLCCRFEKLVLIAKGIAATQPVTPTMSTTIATISSIKDVPRCLNRTALLFFSAMSFHPTLQLWIGQLLLRLRPPNQVHPCERRSGNTRNSLTPGCYTSEGLYL